MKRLLHLAAIVFLAACSASAKTFDVDISTGKPAASNEAFYHGETIEFRAVRGRTAVTNIEYSCIYYQTNGMDQAWWHTDGLVFHPTNDCGAAAYRFFLEGRDEIGRDWHANGLLRFLPSPGFEPNAIERPVLTLDFASIEVINPPWSDTDLTPATNYTDSAANALSAALSAADAVISRDATNYTDAAVADKIPYTVDSQNHLTALTIGTRASGSTNGVYSAAIGQTVVASAIAAFASGFNTRATANASAAFGQNTEASAVRAFAHGGNTVASGGNSHAEGYDTVASGNYSHAEGYGCEAAGGVSHAEGYRTVASGSQSHAEGYKTKATRNDSHTDGTHAIADHGQAYVWSGATLPETADNPAPESDYYHSHGTGTFNINPVAGSYDKSYGVYIGDSRLPTTIVSLLDHGRNYDAFSPTNDYSAGDFVVYNGYLYQFTTNHAAGAWDKSHIQWYQPPAWKRALKAEIAAEVSTDYLHDDYAALTNSTAFKSAVEQVSPPAEIPAKWALANVTNANGAAVSAADVGAAGASEVVKLTGEQSISGTKTFETAAYFNAGLAAPSTIAVYGQDSSVRFEVDNIMTGDHVHFGVDDFGGSIGFGYTKNGSSYRVDLPERSGVLSVIDDIPDVSAIGDDATNYTDFVAGELSTSINQKYPKSSGEQLAQQVAAIGAHINGEDAKVMVTNYNSSTHLPEAEFDINVSNNWLVVWREMTRWNWFIGDVFDPHTNAVARALANKAEKEYAFFDGVTGEPAPDGFFWISQPRVAICAGAAYQRYVDTAGEVWVLESNGMVADINGTTNGYFRISDDQNNVQFEIVKGDSRTVTAAAGMMTRSSVMGVTHWHTTYMVTNAVSAPKAMFCRDIANPEWYAEDDAGCPCNVEWTHPTERIYVCEWWPQGDEPKMFMRSQYGQGSESRIVQNAPVEMQYIVLGGTKYALGTATIDGKTVLTLSTP